MKRASDFLAWPLALAVLALIVLTAVQHRATSSLSERLAALEVRVDQITPRRSGAATPPSAPTAVATPNAAPAHPAGPAVDPGLPRDAFTRFLHSIPGGPRDQAVGAMQDSANDEVGRLTAAIGATEEQSAQIRDRIHEEIAVWYDLLTQFWTAPNGRGSTPNWPFDDPDYAARLQEILVATDRSLLPVLRQDQIAGFIRWRTEYEGRYRGSVQEGD